MSDKAEGRGKHTNLWAFEFPSKGQGVSYDLCRILDKLFHKGKLGEGALANKCGFSIWRQEWKEMIKFLLTDAGLIAEDFVGHGNSRRFFLSDNGREWAEDFYGFTSVQEQAKVEILAAGEKQC